MHQSTENIVDRMSAYNHEPTADQLARAEDVRTALAVAAGEVAACVTGPDATVIVRKLHEAKLLAVDSIMHEDR